jgi:hypothetical protein
MPSTAWRGMIKLSEDTLGGDPICVGGDMKCPACGEITRDAWKRLITELKFPDLRADIGMPAMLMREVAESTFEINVATHLWFEWMRCADNDCNQLVVRATQNRRIPAPLAPEISTEVVVRASISVPPSQRRREWFRSMRVIYRCQLPLGG